jgi:hypothetical protein
MTRGEVLTVGQQLPPDSTAAVEAGLLATVTRNDFAGTARSLRPI